MALDSRLDGPVSGTALKRLCVTCEPQCARMTRLRVAGHDAVPPCYCSGPVRTPAPPALLCSQNGGC